MTIAAASRLRRHTRPRPRHPRWQPTATTAALAMSLAVGLPMAATASTPTYHELTKTGVGYSPYGVAIDRGLHHVYVANQVGESLSIISTVTGKLLATRALGSAQPDNLAVDATTHRVYAVDQAGNKVLIINGRTGREESTVIPVGLVPVGIAVDPSLHRAYVANQSSGTVSVISTQTNRVSRTVRMPIPSRANESGPSELVVDPHNHKVYVDTFGGLVMIDPHNGYATSTIDLGQASGDWFLTGGLAADPATGELFVTLANNDGDQDAVWAVNPAGKRVWQTSVGVGAEPDTVSVDPKRKLVLAGEGFGDSVTVIAEDSGAVRQTMNLGYTPIFSAIDPDTGADYLSLTSNQVAVVGPARAATSLSLRAAKSRVRPGRADTLSGTLHVNGSAAAAAGQRLTIQSLSGGHWRALASVRTRSGGTFFYVVRPKRNTTYRAVLARTITLTAASSAKVTVKA